MRRLAVVLALVLAGCGSSGTETVPPTDQATTTTEALAPPCEEVYADGRTTTESMVDAMCEDTKGETIKELLVPAMTVNECADGRLLLWNVIGWGYVDEPWHTHADDADEQVAPESERTACDA